MEKTINVRLVDMPCAVPGFVLQWDADGYTVILNARLTRGKNIESYVHELLHVQCNDFGKDVNVDLLEAVRHAV